MTDTTKKDLRNAVTAFVSVVGKPSGTSSPVTGAEGSVTRLGLTPTLSNRSDRRSRPSRGRTSASDLLNGQRLSEPMVGLTVTGWRYLLGGSRTDGFNHTFDAPREIAGTIGWLARPPRRRAREAARRARQRAEAG